MQFKTYDLSLPLTDLVQVFKKVLVYLKDSHSQIRHHIFEKKNSIYDLGMYDNLDDENNKIQSSGTLIRNACHSNIAQPPAK